MDSVEPDRRFVAMSCRNTGTRVWDTARDQVIAELPEVTAVGGEFYSAFPAISAAGDRAAIARGKVVEIYALPEARLLRRVEHDAAVHAVAFAATGHDLATGAVDGSLQISRDDAASIVLPPAADGIDAIGFLPDGRVVSADRSGRLRFYDAGRGVVLAELPLSERVRMLRASPDSSRLVTLSTRVRVARPGLWDVQRYAAVAALEGPPARVFSARFVRDGREILTGEVDGAVRRWDGATGRLLQTYKGSSQFYVDAALDPTGQTVVAGGGDGVLRFWNATSGRGIWNFPAHRSFVVGLHFEGRDLVTRGYTGELFRWELPDPETVIEACNAIICAPQTVVK